MQDAQILRPAGVKPHRRGRVAREVIETVALTVCIFLAIHFTVQPYRIDGPSMQPGLHTGEVTVVNLLAYRFGAPQRGDVIVFRPRLSSNPNLQLIKRVIAVPGDTITITATAVYVNGRQLHEPYLAALPSDGVETVTGIVANLKLDKDQYWVMGDNRRDSLDSRSFGAVNRQNIIGKAEALVWPLTSVEWLPTYQSIYKA